MLDRGAEPNAYFMAGNSRYTPLVGVIGEGEEHQPPHPQREALTRLLLERGAEPYDMPPPPHPNLPKRTLHEEAMRRGCTEIAELLLAHGADPTIRNGESMTAAECARQRGMEEVAEILRAGHGADR